MGDRVSISFVNEIDYIHDKRREESVPLFNHWGGSDFPNMHLIGLKNSKEK